MLPEPVCRLELLRRGTIRQEDREAPKRVAGAEPGSRRGSGCGDTGASVVPAAVAPPPPGQPWQGEAAPLPAQGGASEGQGYPRAWNAEDFPANSPPGTQPAPGARGCSPPSPATPRSAWPLAAAAFPDIPLISSEAARFNSQHFGIKSGSHPESNLCLLEQAVVTFPIKM